MNPFKLSVLVFLNVILLQQNYYAQFNSTIKQAEFNSPHNDYFAVNYKEGVVFCSSRKEEVLISRLDKNTLEPLTKYYFSKKNNNNYSQPELFDKVFSGKYQYGAFCFTDNDSTIYFTRSDKDDSSKTYLAIYYAKKTPNGWSYPVPFIYNSPKYNVGHPCISKDGNKMYFVSDMPGGYGGKDIYFCEKINGEWEIPLNIGKGINSSKNELFPFINQSDVLYFASDREGGFGKLDLYNAARLGDRYANSELLPEPINSKSDDYTYFSDVSEINGFFSSNRSGRDKVYQFTDERPQFKKCDTLISFDPCYVFFDETEVNINKLPLVYTWDMGDGTKIREKEASYCFKKPGTYFVKLEILDTLTNSIFFKGQSFEMVIEEPKQANIDVLDTIPLNNEVFMNAKKSKIEAFEPYKYYWDIEKLSSKEGMEVSQTFPMEGNYRINLGVVGKPDKKGAYQKSCVFKNVYASAAMDYNNYLASIKSKNENDDSSMLALKNDVEALASKNNLIESSKSTSTLNYLTTEQKIDNLFESENTYVSENEIKATLASLNMGREEKIEMLKSLNISTIYREEAENVVYRIEIINSKDKIALSNKFFEPLRPKYNVTENYLSKEEIYSYAIGEENELTDAYPLYKELKKLNYINATVKGYPSENIVEFNDIDNIKKESLNNSIFRTDYVFFKTMQYEVEPSFYPTLQKIVELMNKFPEITIEISAHTDNTGTREYNLLLSEKRAQNTMDYLVSNGIDKKKLTAFGYGFDKPIDTNNTEEGRQKNRRVDFKIIEKK